MKTTLPRYNPQKSDAEHIDLILPFLIDSNPNYRYTTIDGFKAFKFRCPLCGDAKTTSEAKLFPKRVAKWKEHLNGVWKKEYKTEWKYLCNKGKNTCDCRGIHTFEHFYACYRGFCEGSSRHNDGKIRLSEKKQHFVY